MKQVWIALAVIAIILGVGAAALAPVGTFFAIRSAGLALDAHDLEQLVDSGAMIDSLRPQLAAVAPQPKPKAANDPIGNIINSVTHVFNQAKAAVEVGPVAESYATPQALAALTYGYGRAAPQTDVKTLSLIKSPPFPNLVFWGLSRVRLSVTGAGGNVTTFTFKRTGFIVWRLTAVTLPPASN